MRTSSGPGRSRRGLLLRVEAEVPAGRALILTNTFRGADVVTPGQEAPIRWHPMRGDLQLAPVTTAEAARLPALAEAFDRDEVGKITAASLRCGGAFAGIRVLPATSPAESVRWTFRARFEGPACVAEKVAVEHLDAGGKVVDPGQLEREPPVSPPALKAAVKSEPVKSEAKVETKDANADPASPLATGGGCGRRGGRGRAGPRRAGHR